MEAVSRRQAAGRGAWGCVLILAAGAAGLAARALPQTTATGVGGSGPEPVLGITVRVYNYAHLDTPVLADSEAVTRAIFRQAGVEAMWIDCPLSRAEYDRYPGCQKEMGTTDFVLRILTRSMAMKVATRDEPLGFAQPCPEDEPACCLSIFYYCIDELAAQGHARAERILGHAIAHELGHLLLGSNAHAPNGIMRGLWSRDDLKRMAWSYLLFTPDQCRQLKAGILRRFKHPEPDQASNPPSANYVLPELP